jgi:hypothetical protein
MVLLTKRVVFIHCGRRDGPATVVSLLVIEQRSDLFTAFPWEKVVHLKLKL